VQRARARQCLSVQRRVCVWVVHGWVCVCVRATDRKDAAHVLVNVDDTTVVGLDWARLDDREVDGTLGAPLAHKAVQVRRHLHADACTRVNRRATCTCTPRVSAATRIHASTRSHSETERETCTQSSTHISAPMPGVRMAFLHARRGRSARSRRTVLLPSSGSSALAGHASTAAPARCPDPSAAASASKSTYRRPPLSLHHITHMVRIYLSTWAAGAARLARGGGGA
jgi:hypothetical protein